MEFLKRHARLSENDARNGLRNHFLRLVREGTVARSFADFQALLEQELAGLVITAHPTFMLTQEAWVEAKKQNAANLHYPTRPPRLEEEVALASDALQAIRRAIRQVLRIAIDVAAESYLDHLTEITPRFLTVASWVGFDLDGRTDIDWSKSLEIRYQLALEGIAELQDLLGEMAWPGDVSASRDQLAANLDIFHECFSLGAELLSAGDVAALNRAAMARRPAKEQAINDINQALEVLLSQSLPIQLIKDLLLFRAEWQNFGLGLSHIHFRLNAIQIHNAIRSEINLERSPDHSPSRRHYLAAISKLLDNVEPVNVHYGDLAKEATTAKRLFMMAAQFEKHFDRHTPIRLLIAESDTPFTVLAALYYARVFDVADHVEISPLFETAIGLERGDRVISELLDNKHFVDYIRDQGRFCVQLGFSDSGRYIGQPAATLAIERFKLRLIQLWQACDLGDIQLVFFDTHGESIGRGAHPKSLQDRFLYTHAAQVRTALSQFSAPAKHEVSFQGGDGYLWFLSEESAFATVSAFLLSRLQDVEDVQGRLDPFYEQSGWSLDFFLTLTDYHQHLSDHPGYKALLGSIGPNLLFPTGSRAVKRQGGSKSGQGLESISALRAIPHNAILQQFGYLANTLAGVGTAIDRGPDKFISMLEGSDRLHRLMELVLAARARGDLSVLKDYVDMMSPSAWLDRADEAQDAVTRDCARKVSKALETTFDHQAMAALIRKLRRDADCLEDAVRDCQVLKSMAPKRDDEIVHLHHQRLERISFIYLKAMEVPRFSTRADVSIEDLVAGLLRLEIPETLAALRKIFPLSQPDSEFEDYGEETTYKTRTSGYVREHEDIFDPIEEAYHHVLTLSAAIAQRIGAFG